MKKKFPTKIVIFTVLCILFATVLPRMLKNDYLMTVAATAMVYSIVVYGLSIILGMGGMVTFSTAGMMGVGAFASGIATARLGLPSFAGIFVSIAVVGIFSFLIGLVLLRLKDTYFSFSTIALTQIIYVVLLNWKKVTGGAEGLSNIPRLSLGSLVLDTPLKMFYGYFVISVLCGLIVYRIRTTTLGRSLSAIRDNEIAANSMGVNIYRTKVIGFVISSIFAGIAGTLYAHLTTYLSAEAFNFDQSVLYLIMVMLGGVQSTIGAFVSSVLLTLLPELMRFLQSYYKFIYGIGVVLVMIFMPRGFAGIFKDVFDKIKHNRSLKKAADANKVNDTNAIK